ncbi:hypothetical protein HGB24_02135 [Candidatus Saccharibacteria bacterium]|nr:hypothetical protein [Candidatus Saccharibacteria bacterium]
MSKKPLQAVTLNKILVATIFMILTLSIVGFYFAQNWLDSIASEMSNNDSNNNPGMSLSQIETNIINNKAIAEKAAGILSNLTKYQEQMSSDLSRYASLSGIKINKFDFADESQTLVISNEVKANSVTISLQNPVQAPSFIKFLKYIETNTPKMQVRHLAISNALGNGENSLIVDSLIIETYYR